MFCTAYSVASIIYESGIDNTPQGPAAHNVMKDHNNRSHHGDCLAKPASRGFLRIALFLAFAAMNCTLFPTLSIGQSADSLYNDAGKAYDSGDTKRAIDLYEQLV